MSLRDVVGQEGALRMLLGARRMGRLASSYLFAGEQGIGKRFAALNFAKALNCLDPVDLDACDGCPSCVKIDSGTHPDFLLVEPDGDQIKVEQVRRLGEALSLTAYEAKVKVAVMDDAEAMNPSAANAFLKTLEEPPAASLIILVSSSPDRLPDTVRSRCSRINFRPLSPGDCEKVMKKSVKKDLSVLVRLSMGRPGLALKENLIKERDRCMADLGGGAEGRHAWKDRRDIERWLEMQMLIIRDMAVAKITGGREGLINLDRAEELGRLGESAALTGIIEGYVKLMELKGRLGFNLNKAITWNYAQGVLEELKGNA
jgi:DNA polymerase-3 subunit delta'